MRHAPAATQVLVIGAGPVGVALALELALHGVTSTVVESRSEIPPNPRCNTTNARSMEIFRRLGVADAVRKAGLPADNSTDVVYMTAMNGHEIQRFARQTPQDVLKGHFHGIGGNWPTPEPQHFISQLYMEPPLRAHAQTKPEIDLCLGWEFVGLTQDQTGVAAQLREVATGKLQTVQASYLVGADGSNSPVRKHMGARLEGTAKIGDACTVFIRAPRLTELYAKHPGWMYRFMGGVIVVAIDGVDQWLVHTHPPVGVALKDFDFEPAMFAAIGERFDYEIINDARWTARAMVVNKYREGRVFVAGDAAHIWIPMGGFGMNSGVGDALAIGWRLAGVLQGWLNEAILDTYEQERQPLGGEVATQAVRWGAELRPLMRPEPAEDQLMRQSTAQGQAARDALRDRLVKINTSEWESVGMQLGLSYANSPLFAYEGVAPPPMRVDHYVESSAPGARAPHVWRVSRPATSPTSPTPGLDVGDLILSFWQTDKLQKVQAAIAHAAQAAKAASAAQAPIPQAPTASPAAGSTASVPSRKALADDFGRGFTLLRIGTSPGLATQSQGLMEAAKTRAIPLVVVDVPEPAASQKYEGYPLVLVRPDQHIVWRGHAAPADANALLDQVTGASIAPRQVVSRLAQTLQTGLAAPAQLLERRGVLYWQSATGPEPGPAAETSIWRLDPAIGVVRPCTDPKTLDLLAAEFAASTAGPQVTTPDGNTRLFAEAKPHPHIAQARIAEDGSLREARSFIDLATLGVCTGMAIEKSGAVWLCLPQEGAVLRFDRAGRLTDRLSTPQGVPTCCALGTAGQRLYVAGTSETSAAQGWLAVLSLWVPQI